MKNLKMKFLFQMRINPSCMSKDIKPAIVSIVLDLNQGDIWLEDLSNFIQYYLINIKICK